MNIKIDFMNIYFINIYKKMNINILFDRNNKQRDSLNFNLNLF